MHELAVRVKGVRDEAIEVRSFELVRDGGGRLPAFAAGSHIHVHLAPGLVRQYSLCNRPDETESYVKSVYLDKEMPGCDPPPFYQYLGRLSASDRVDRCQHTVYIPPAYVVIDVGVRPLGDVPGSNRVDGRVINMTTPGTATTTHYFWAFARNFRLDELAVTEFLRENVGRTFDEDKDMLEAQQYNLGSETEPVFQVAVKADAGPTQARRLLASMIEAESRGSQ